MKKNLFISLLLIMCFSVFANEPQDQNFKKNEIQFKTGSVLFKAYSKEFLAFVSAKDGYNSFIKIVPADNNYNFSPVLIEKIQNYIESNNNINFQKII